LASPRYTTVVKRYASLSLITARPCVADFDHGRWPTIITNIVSTLSNEIHTLTLSSDDNSAKIEEGKTIIRGLSALKHDMGRNKVLAYVPPRRTVWFRADAGE
jgi:hypothetical protein